MPPRKIEYLLWGLIDVDATWTKIKQDCHDFNCNFNAVCELIECNMPVSALNASIKFCSAYLMSLATQQLMCWKPGWGSNILLNKW